MTATQDSASESDDEDDTFEEQRARVDKPMRRLFRQYGSLHRRPLGIGLGASLFAHTLALLPPFVLGLAVDAVFLQTEPYDLPLVPDSWLPTGQVDLFWLSAGIVAASFFLSALFQWGKGWGLSVFAQRVQHDVRADTYDAMQGLDLGFFADKQTGELMSILNNDVNRLEQFLNGGLGVLTQLLVTVLGVAGLLFYVNPQLALLTLVTVPIIAVFTHKFVQTIQPMYADVRSTVGRMNSRLENNLGGIEVIKASNTETYETDRVTDTSQEYYDTNVRAITTRVKFFPGLQLTAGIGFVITFVVGGVWVFQGAPGPFSGPLSVGNFVTFVYLGQRLIWPMAQFGQLINLYQRAQASAERIFGLVDEPTDLPEREDATDLVVTDGRVEYDDVTFGYGRDDDEDATVLDGVSFDLDSGEMLALVGPTGAGKSTVLKLLPRLYDVDSGAIRIDGHDVRDVTLGSLRESIGYVSQETFLFYGSVKENIAYGTFDATDEEIREAAKMAEAHEFITEFEEGYDTLVGERGVKLSGGQKQRVGIARVLLQDPDILILDEATSDVDTETELRIQRSIDRLVEDRTVLAIAHRLSTIKDADQILVLDDGEVVERGTHDRLLDAEGVYADLWGVQAGEKSALPNH
ncbi:ABC transporter ATP-binding protein [Halomarina rubra]|uniref:ABC transporter ATP-binding protein n=1 Tax=Halomarina rubra TaxID=2071873 RepID=A0ABD6AQ42_9EURY|nr:ABC transporter ATP-binding protein [Halomarina rubra]